MREFHTDPRRVDDVLELVEYAIEYAIARDAQLARRAGRRTRPASRGFPPGRHRIRSRRQFSMSWPEGGARVSRWAARSRRR
jgi:hypothetical protein